MSKLELVTSTTMIEFLENFLPTEDAQYITELCHKKDNRFLGDDHIEVFAELCNLNDEDEIVKKLCIPYILFSNHYFLLDATIDNHLTHPTDILYVSHLLFITLSPILAEAHKCLSKEQSQKLYRIIGDKISANSRAIRQEIIYRTSVHDTQLDDFEMIVGRSNSTILFYQILCVLTNTPENKEVTRILEELVYYMQLGDDIGDWVDDYNNHRYTVLLQECLMGMSKKDGLDIQKVQKRLYIDGVYENYMSRIVNNLDRLIKEIGELNNVNSQRLLAFIRNRREDAYNLLYDILEAKMKAIGSID